jgi:hypothetical protein
MPTPNHKRKRVTPETSERNGAPAPSRATARATPKLTAVPSGLKDRNAEVVSQADIRLCAYRKWENAGKPAGAGVRFWLEAEQELVHIE